MGAGEDAASPDQLGEARTKLQDLLSSSSHYQPQSVLARLQGTDLHVETAAVFGRVYALSFFLFTEKHIKITVYFIVIVKYVITLVATKYSSNLEFYLQSTVADTIFEYELYI